jgi:hypothetical protein
MKKRLVLSFLIIFLISCGSKTAPSTVQKDTTPPIINYVSVSPSPVYEDRFFVLTADVSDLESNFDVTYDLDNDDVYDDGDSGYYTVAGNKVIKVRAISQGGTTINYYNLNIGAVELNLLLNFIAISYYYYTNWGIDYYITNYSNVPIKITNGGYIIFDILNNPINMRSDFRITYSYAPFIGEYISSEASTVLSSLYGESDVITPYYFSLKFDFDDGYGHLAVATFSDNFVVDYSK